MNNVYMLLKCLLNSLYKVKARTYSSDFKNSNIKLILVREYDK